MTHEDATQLIDVLQHLEQCHGAITGLLGVIALIIAIKK